MGDRGRDGLLLIYFFLYREMGFCTAVWWCDRACQKMHRHAPSLNGRCINVLKYIGQSPKCLSNREIVKFTKAMEGEGVRWGREGGGGAFQ
jgi:hypothetical protein